MDISILGPLQVVDAGRPLGRMRPKVKELLATLASVRGAWVPPRMLTELMWDDPAGKIPTARMTVLLARDYLGASAWRLNSARPDGYRLILDQPGDRLDLTEFEGLVTAGTAAAGSGDHVRAVQWLERALALWPAERPMPDVPGTHEMDLQVTHRIRETYAAARHTWLEQRIALGAHREIIPEIEALVGRDPLEERWWQLLMLARLRSGGRASALRVFERARQAVEGEGMDLGEDLLVARDRIEAGEQDLLAAEPEVGRVTLAAPVSTPQQLPADLPDFTGRLTECAALTALLAGADAAGAVPRVAVTGQPGIGKTALAVHAAQQVRDAYPDGQLYVRLEGTSSRPREVGQVLGEVLRALGVAGAAVPEGLHERSAAYRSLLAGQRVLVVLDDALDAAQVEPLVPGTPGCAVIVTGRNRLIAGPGAHLLPLEPFSAEDTLNLVRMIIGDARVRSDQRGQRVLVAACEGSPLATRIVGERLATRPSWGLGAFAAGMAGRRLDELVLGELDVRSRIALSYHRLSAQDARVLRTITDLGDADFAGWSIEMAVGEACGPSLAHLVDQNLLADHGLGRYVCHGLIRDYCLERRAADPTADFALERLVAGAIGVVEEAAGRLAGRETGPAGARLSLVSATAGTWRQLDRDPRAWLEAEWRMLTRLTESTWRAGRHRDAYDLAVALTRCLDAGLAVEAGEAERVAVVLGQAADRLGQPSRPPARPPDRATSLASA